MPPSISLERDLFKHVRGVLARSERLARRSAIVTSASRHAREAALLVPHCAWCGALRLGEQWVRPEEVPAFLELQLEGRRTHGICPECFASVQRRTADSRPLPPSTVLIRSDGPLAVESLTRALGGYALRERADFVLEVTLPDGGGAAVNALLSRVSVCLQENRLAPVTIELADRAYVLG